MRRSKKLASAMQGRLGRATPGRQNGTGNARVQYERYLALARAAASAGDAIETENYYQHAEHYFRLMRASGIAG